MTAAGVWTYTLDNANILVDALDVGDTLTDTFTLTTVDGAAQVVTSTIHGSSDADPNDFDFLATGTHEVSDSAFVYGTSGGDGIEGAGREGQIIYGGAGNDTINGTGNSDIHNDTSNGDGGNDTIYGGSDTINSNNGGDTIIGGFGSDLLTGSNGDDRFVYLSVADSNAAQFDVISDFKSGSDRINLTALGALGLSILALTSTSTSVPAHTIAWLYDSAANETIVYVNPTDHTLSIGDSGLLEIHLQGIATIQASDFVYEPTTAPVLVAGETVDLALAATAENDGTLVTTTADVSSGSTVSDSALVADGSWTTTDEYFSFDAARDRFDSIDYARLTSSDEVRAYSTEDTNGDAAGTLTNEQSIVLQRVHVTVTENSFVFDQAPVLDDLGATTIGEMMFLNDTTHHAHITALSAAGDIALLQLNVTGTHVHTIDTGSNGHSGDKEASGTHGPAVASSNGHSGVEEASGTHGPAGASSNGHSGDKEASGTHGPAVTSSNGHSRDKEASETHGGDQAILSEKGADGVAAMPGAGVHDFEPTSTANVVLGWGSAGLNGHGNSFHFKGEISGFEGPDVINHEDVDLALASNNRENAAGPHGPPAISEEAQTTELSLLEQHSAHTGSAVVTHLNDLMV